MNSKKTIGGIIIFSSLFLFIIYAIQFTLDHMYKTRVTHKITRLLKHEIDKNIMIFGSSVAYVQFDPAIITDSTGMSTYNMGWDGTFFVQYRCLMQEYLTYEKQCKYVILVADLETFGGNELITRPEFYYPYLSNPYVYASLHNIEPDKIFKAKYIPGYKLTLLSSAFYTQLFLKSATATDSFNGYSPHYSKFDSTKKNTKSFKASNKEERYNDFKETVNAYVNKGIKVVIVFSPIYSEGYKMITGMEELKKKFAILADNKNIHFLDYTQDSLCNNKEVFYNFSHLNKEGATIFSKKFSSDLFAIMRK